VLKLLTEVYERSKQFIFAFADDDDRKLGIDRHLVAFWPRVGVELDASSNRLTDEVAVRGRALLLKVFGYHLGQSRF